MLLSVLSFGFISLCSGSLNGGDCGHGRWFPANWVLSSCHGECEDSSEDCRTVQVGNSTTCGCLDLETGNITLMRCCRLVVTHPTPTTSEYDTEGNCNSCDEPGTCHKVTVVNDGIIVHVEAKCI